jgi:hypothetical protein
MVRGHHKSADQQHEKQCGNEQSEEWSRRIRCVEIVEPQQGRVQHCDFVLCLRAAVFCHDGVKNSDRQAVGSGRMHTSAQTIRCLTAGLEARLPNLVGRMDFGKRTNASVRLGNVNETGINQSE